MKSIIESDSLTEKHNFEMNEYQSNLKITAELRFSCPAKVDFDVIKPMRDDCP